MKIRTVIHKIINTYNDYFIAILIINKYHFKSWQMSNHDISQRTLSSFSIKHFFFSSFRWNYIHISNGSLLPLDSFQAFVENALVPCVCDPLNG